MQYLTRRIVVHHGNASSQISPQTSDLLTGQNVELMAYPLYSPNLTSKDFSLLTHIKTNMRGQRFSSPEDTVGVFKNHFCRCLNRSEKTNTNDGRTSKHADYGYAKKCQTFVW